MSENDEAIEAETTVSAAPSESAEEEFHPFDETSDAFSPSVIKKATGEDGLPTQVAPPGSGMSDIPPLSPETLVCMGDFSSFVQRDKWGNIEAEFPPDEVHQDATGAWWTGITFDQRVEPIRPPCEHYVRQITQWDKDPTKKDHLRLCSARRTTEGTFMTLKDSAMWACSMRKPRHKESEKLISEFDLLKMKQGALRTAYTIKGSSDD